MRQPSPRYGPALMWSGQGLLMYGGRSAEALTNSDLWRLDWESRCWEKVYAADTPVPTQHAAALLLPRGFKSPSWDTDTNPLVVVAAPATLGTGTGLGIYTRDVTLQMGSRDVCLDPERPPNWVVTNSSAEWRLQDHGAWREYHAGGLEQPVLSAESETDVELAAAAPIPFGASVEFSLVWQDAYDQRLLMFGGAAFSSDSWRFRRHAWAFYPQDALPYFDNVREFERELLRNITQKEVINFGRDQVVILSGAIVWVMFFFGVFCVCCSCPCFCLYHQSKRRSKEHAKNEEIVWSQQLEMVIQATMRHTNQQSRISQAEQERRRPPLRA
uniref:Uncharacterized protein n=1 Tax=Haptolina ericina TaxID=156174 RepID=A0A7S3B4C6_9EUKA